MQIFTMAFIQSSYRSIIYNTQNGISCDKIDSLLFCGSAKQMWFWVAFYWLVMFWFDAEADDLPNSFIKFLVSNGQNLFEFFEKFEFQKAVKFQISKICYSKYQTWRELFMILIIGISYVNKFIDRYRQKCALVINIWIYSFISDDENIYFKKSLLIFKFPNSVYASIWFYFQYLEEENKTMISFELIWMPKLN